MSGAVVGAPVGIAYRMGELVLDVVRPESLRCLASGLAFRIAVSVSGSWGNYLVGLGVIPIVTPRQIQDALG